MAANINVDDRANIDTLVAASIDNPNISKKLRLFDEVDYISNSELKSPRQFDWLSRAQSFELCPLGCSNMDPRSSELCDLPLPTDTVFNDDQHLDEMGEKARDATAMLKALSHEGRLMILCYLAHGEKSVTELEEILSMRQSAVSQQLARLRADSLIEARRDGKTIYYRITDSRAHKIMELVYDLFCGPDAERR